MSKRERCEDLGRLSVMLDNIIDHELFDKFSLYSKHYTLEEDLAKLTEEKRSDVLWDIQRHTKQIQEMLYECLEIAQGQDPLNEEPHVLG